MPRHEDGLSNFYERTYLWFLAAPWSGTTLMLKMLATSQNVSTQIDDFTKAYQGEGAMSRLLYHPDYKDEDFEAYNTECPFDMEKIEEGLTKHWDLTKPILCDKTCGYEFLLRHEQWSKYWEGKDANVKYLAMVKDPWQHRGDPKLWIDCNERLMEILEAKEIDVHLVKYEDFVEDPRMTTFHLIRWCPDLFCLDYSNKEDHGITYASGPIEPKSKDRYVDYKLAKIRMDGDVERFNRVAKYFGYRTHDEVQEGHVIGYVSKESIDILKKELDDAVEKQKERLALLE